MEREREMLQKNYKPVDILNGFVKIYEIYCTSLNLLLWLKYSQFLTQPTEYNTV